MYNPLQVFGKLFQAKTCYYQHWDELRKAKAIRERIKGKNYHEEQCNKILSTIDKSKYKLHMECYKKFTLINSNNKYNKVQTNEARETRPLPSRQSELIEGKILFYSISSNKCPWCLFNFESFGGGVY